MPTLIGGEAAIAIENSLDCYKTGDSFARTPTPVSTVTARSARDSFRPLFAIGWTGKPGHIATAG